MPLPCSVTVHIQLHVHIEEFVMWLDLFFLCIDDG